MDARQVAAVRGQESTLAMRLISMPAPSLIMEPPNPSLERTRVSVVDVRLTPSLTCAGARAAQLSR